MGDILNLPNLFMKITKFDYAKQQWLLVFTIACFVLNSCVAGNLTMEAEVKKYSGDGVIRTCSNILMPGYAIEFPKFDASRPYTARYRVSHVPQLHRIDGRSDPVVYLRFHSNIGFVKTQELKKHLTARFRVSLVDSQGQVTHSIEVPLSSSGWTETQNLYGISKDRFHFDPDASYILNVSYTPGAVPPPAEQVYFEIDNCAFY